MPARSMAGAGCYFAVTKALASARPNAGPALTATTLAARSLKFRCLRTGNPSPNHRSSFSAPWSGE